MSIKVTTDWSRIRTRIKSGKAALIAAVTEQVITDGNFFCRQDQGILMSSAQSASVPSKGLAVWDTPYARRVYYTGTPSKDVNANASLMWVEKARAAFGADWQKIADTSFKGGMG